MKPRQKRILFAAIALAGVAVAATLVIQALRSNLAYFFSPTQVLANEAPVDRLFRIGGMVKEGSLTRADQNLDVQFVVTDTAADVKVVYNGILPDLFKEGQGVVARGRLSTDGVFRAEEVLAKHDESYMPPEAAYAIDAAKSLQQ
ncbi:MAG: cytochrome c maturation protein CcmE [Thiotrichales bacterium]